VSTESSGQLPGNSRDVSEQLAGHVSPSADESPRQSWQDGSQMTWQLTSQSMPHPAQHPRNSRAISRQRSGKST